MRNIKAVQTLFGPAFLSESFASRAYILTEKRLKLKIGFLLCFYLSAVYKKTNP